MKMNKLALACGVALLGASTVAQAEFTANVALTTDYVFRGVTQNDGEMAIQGGFDYSHDSGFYAGVWASNVDDTAYSGATIEVDTYIGYATELGGIGVDLMALRYNYPGTTFDDNNTNEYSVTLSKDFDVAAISGGVAYSDDWFGAGDATYLHAGVDVPVGPATLSATYGSTDIDTGGDYKDWSVGVSGDVKGFGLSLAYTDTDISGQDGRVAFTVSKSF